MIQTHRHRCRHTNKDTQHTQGSIQWYTHINTCQLCNKSGYSCYGIGLDVMSQLSLSNELDTWSRDVNMDFKKGDCLFGAVKLTKNADHNKYGYSG